MLLVEPPTLNVVVGAMEQAVANVLRLVDYAAVGAAYAWELRSEARKSSQRVG
jgi:hypothetical protein